MRSCLLCICLVLLPACGNNGTDTPVSNATVGVIGTVEQAGLKGTQWSLQQIDKISHTGALDAAKLLTEASAAGVIFLEANGTLMTAEAINKYLIDCILKNLNPLVAMGVDTASSILDDVLQVPAGQMLTKVELDLLAAFVKGLGEGAAAFTAGKTLDKAPVVTKSMKRRAWLCKPE